MEPSWVIGILASFSRPVIVKVEWDGTEVVSCCLPQFPGWESSVGHQLAIIVFTPHPLFS